MVDFVFGEHSYGSMPKISSWLMSGTIKTGKFCSIADNLRFMIDGNHRTDTFTTYPLHILDINVNSLPCGKELPTIGNDVWIAHNVTIYSGVHIGDGAVIAGNSVVTKSVPPYAIVGGNPARILKYRFSQDIIQELLRYQWWNFSMDIIKNRLSPTYENIENSVREMKKIYYELHPDRLEN